MTGSSPCRRPNSSSSTTSWSTRTASRTCAHPPLGRMVVCLHARPPARPLTRLRAVLVDQLDKLARQPARSHPGACGWSATPRTTSRRRARSSSSSSSTARLRSLQGGTLSVQLDGHTPGLFVRAKVYAADACTSITCCAGQIRDMPPDECLFPPAAVFSRCTVS